MERFFHCRSKQCSGALPRLPRLTAFRLGESSRSQWFLRASLDNYTTRNAFVQQATLPSPRANLFNRSNPGANFVTNVAALPVPAAEAHAGDIMNLCANAACTSTHPISKLSQLAVPAGGLGDFFGPGTTVGIPFAAQVGARFTF